MKNRGLGSRRWIACAVGMLLALPAPHEVVGGATSSAPHVSAGSGTRGHEDGRFSRLSHRLARKARAAQLGESDPEEAVDVIVGFNAGEDATDEGFAARRGAVKRRGYKKLPFQAVRVPARELESLADDPGVRFVSPDSQVFAASLPARQTARVPGSTSSLNTANVNYKGSGVTVAVLDTGVYPHDDFYNTLAAQYDFVNGAGGVRTSLNDPFGHGTHVAGMVAADGYHSTSSKYQGVSTRANVLALRVLDSNGGGRLSDVLDALDWLLTVGKTQYNVRVANLSFGKGVEEAQALDPLVQAVNALWDSGMVVIVSAGNFGADGHYTICSPGNSRKVITVGSLTDAGTGTSYGDDYISTYSSRGPTLFDHVLKPDLVAPGNKIVGPYASGARLRSQLPANRVFCGDGSSSCSWAYMQLSGTSMAAGLVSGAVARMLDKDPSLGPNTIKARLMKTARKISGDPTRVGAGVLNVEDAMNETAYMYTYALSPLMGLSSSGSVVYVQDTAKLWNSSQWSATYIWKDASYWASNSPVTYNGYLWSNGSLWSDSSLWTDGYIWSNGFIWSDTVHPASIAVEDP
jgi:serine protease AprX